MPIEMSCPLTPGGPIGRMRWYPRQDTSITSATEPILSPVRSFINILLRLHTAQTLSLSFRPAEVRDTANTLKGWHSQGFLHHNSQCCRSLAAACLPSLAPLRRRTRRTGASIYQSGFRVFWSRQSTYSPIRAGLRLRLTSHSVVADQGRTTSRGRCRSLLTSRIRHRCAVSVSFGYVSMV
jgi:hypothetical protein